MLSLERLRRLLLRSRSRLQREKIRERVLVVESGGVFGKVAESPIGGLGLREIPFVHCIWWRALEHWAVGSRL